MDSTCSRRYSIKYRKRGNTRSNRKSSSLEEIKEEEIVGIVVKRGNRKVSNHLNTRVILIAPIFSLYDVVPMPNPPNPHNKQPSPSTAIPLKKCFLITYAIIRLYTNYQPMGVF